MGAVAAAVVQEVPEHPEEVLGIFLSPPSHSITFPLTPKSVSPLAPSLESSSGPSSAS